ncbi:hypothetical protein VOLCADRAFT_94425 [Volvox carteri f. nagariensis]|uniref:Nuclear pore complex protein NUP96 C-terminal domain-containing protein n=1 Tax=Volvox carteri f. nagariensis TaxID=3068 RepID=D8U4S0_VOLCA|nr:uncharacterized protein VOLCADRAFT_94425 [Volvox carteri f. nagariensis]EFJ45238.1 hypothetical protein VOLCADRAFT_94425 [Volvox carteri f. nagariensis]|eukprot:XP_002953614.1 hypothetical protein VOLCADRAFT_94425 [Volvox carteri f. nagariensis]
MLTSGRRASCFEPCACTRNYSFQDESLLFYGSAGAEQDMSEACAQLRFGDDMVAEGEVSGGVIGPETAALGGRGVAGGGGRAAVAGRAAAMVAAAAATAGVTAVTAWRRPSAALAPGAPAAVMARGEELLSAADGVAGGGGFGGAIASSPISLALARPVTSRPMAAMTDFAAAAVLPLREVRTAGNLTDAGLAMGRSFRVGWGPEGRLVVPGAADAATATEICVTRVRVEGEGAAYGEASYGSGAISAGSEEAEALEALRDRLRAGLEVHLAASQPQKAAADCDNQDAAASGDSIVPHWRLAVDSRELTVLVERHVRVCEKQLQQLTGGSGASGGADGAGRSGCGGAAVDGDVDHPDARRLRHEIETWRLVETLFAKIDGEVPSDGTAGDEAEQGSPPGATQVPLRLTTGSPLVPASRGAGDMMVLSTPPSKSLPSASAKDAAVLPPEYEMNDEGDGEASDVEAGEAGGGGDASRLSSQRPMPSPTLLAAHQRRAQLSLWLQRQARRRVEEDLLTASSCAAVVLQLLAGHQLGAAVGAAVAGGDPRLAMLIARLMVWQQSGFLEHMVPERLAAYQLLSGEVLEPQRLMSLDWRRLLGLYLWYGTPNTKSPVTAVNQYMMDRHAEPSIVPHPAPYHVEGLQPSATGAVAGSSAATSGSTDVQWELLQLWATTPAAATADCLASGQEATATGVAAAAARALGAWLAGGGCSRLLRCSGYSPNPLDHSLAWYLMTALQAAGVLPRPRTLGGIDDGHGASAAAYDNEMLTTTLEFISQLQLAGGLCEWAVFVALTIPDLEEGGPAVRQRVVQELLALTVPEWAGDSSRELFLEGTLSVPEQLLAKARATWAQYTRDDDARCAALLAAGDAAAAHDVFVSSVAPALFLSGAWDELARLVADLEPAATAIPSWSTGGGLYGGYLAIFGRQLVAATVAAAGSVGSGGGAAPAMPEGVTLEALIEFAMHVQEAQMALNAAGSGDMVAAGGCVGGAATPQALDETAERSRLRRRLVLSRISARLHGALMSVSATAVAVQADGGTSGPAADLEARCAGLQSALALQGCLVAELQLGGVAVAVAEAGARVACSS